MHDQAFVGMYTRPGRLDCRRCSRRNHGLGTSRGSVVLREQNTMRHIMRLVLAAMGPDHRFRTSAGLVVCSLASAPPTRSSCGLRRRGSRSWAATNGGVGQAGTMLAKQAYEVIPRMLKAWDGMHGGSRLK